MHVYILMQQCAKKIVMGKVQKFFSGLAGWLGNGKFKNVRMLIIPTYMGAAVSVSTG